MCKKKYIYIHTYVHFFYLHIDEHMYKYQLRLWLSNLQLQGFTPPNSEVITKNDRHNLTGNTNPSFTRSETQFGVHSSSWSFPHVGCIWVSPNQYLSVQCSCISWLQDQHHFKWNNGTRNLISWNISLGPAMTSLAKSTVNSLHVEIYNSQTSRTHLFERVK